MKKSGHYAIVLDKKRGSLLFNLNVAENIMADIPQSLYEARGGDEKLTISWQCCSSPAVYFLVRLETWLPILQGIADKGSA